MNSRLISLALVLLFSGPTSVFSVSLLGTRAVDSSDIVVLGGSFSPPTIEHGGVLARIVQRFGFSEGRKLTATPYKEGAVSSDITLELTRISVSNFDEILDLYSIPYRSFESPQDGIAVFSLADGKQVTIKVDDSDIRNGIKEDTLKSLQNLHREKGDARKVFWISGGDSFSSVPQWTSEWRQLFDHANWIVVTRPGYDTGDKQINFFRDNPLSAVFDNEFLNRYDYTFDQVNLVHHYRNKDSSKPDIFVINQVALNDSSSLNRKSLAEQGDHDHAQAGLQPSVFARCLSAGYYSSKAIPGEYNLFSRKNLSIFLRWLRTNIEKTNHENRLDPEDQEVYGQMLHALVASSEVVAEGLKNRSRIEAVQNKIKETVIDFKTNLKVLTNRKSLVRRFNDLVSSTGARGLAIALIIGQVLELSVIPATVAKIYGAPGLAAVPGLQTEFLILPIWLGWKLFKNYRERTRLAGNLKNYSLVNDYLHQLLRGDPLAIESRIEFGEGSGFGKGPITLNLIRSRLPKWIPLFLRRMDDRRIRWHDLNISTNELRAIINDSTLSDLLGEAAGKHNAVLSDLLFVAAQRNEESLWKFHFLLGH